MSDNTGISPADAGGIIGIALGGLGAIGGGIAWLFSRGDARRGERETKFLAWEKRLADRETQLEQGRTAYTKQLEERLDGLTDEVDRLREEADGRADQEKARNIQNTALRLAFELVSAALRKLDPFNIALAQAQQLLASAFPLDASIPADMLGSLTTLHDKGA